MTDMPLALTIILTILMSLGFLSFVGLFSALAIQSWMDVFDTWRRRR